MKPTHHRTLRPAHPGRPPQRGAGHPAQPTRTAPARGSTRPTDLAGLVAAADDLEQALEALATAPGTRAAVLTELRHRRPGTDRPSPWSTAVLVRLVGRVGGLEGLAAVVPFLADGNPLVQVEAAEALDDTSLGDLRTVLERLARECPDGEFWDAVLGLLESRDERGIGRLVLELTDRLRAPGPLAAMLEALPYLIAPDEVSATRKALSRFLQDTRAVPDAETDEGPVTLALVAAQALDALLEMTTGAEAADRDGER